MSTFAIIEICGKFVNTFYQIFVEIFSPYDYNVDGKGVFVMTIGQRIRDKRIELSMSQDELAKKVGYKSRSSIQKIEKARNLPLPKVEKMATALGCTPSYLMGWDTSDGERTAHGQLIDAYVHREKRDELYSVYESLSPEKKVAFESYLTYLQSQP